MLINSGGNTTTEVKDLSSYTGLFFKQITDIESDFTIKVINWSLPEQPVDGVLKDKKYEPALYMSPYYSRKIMRGDGETILDIPDINITSKNIKLRQVITSGGITNLFIHKSANTDVEDIANGEMGTDNSVVLDVLNDQWKTYVYTKRDTDRQMTSAYAWKNAINNLIYMSYGGALVGSRSASEQPVFQPGFQGLGSYTYVNYAMGQNGNPYVGGTYPGVNTPGGLTKYGKRMASATGLAAGASIVTSLVDAHVMWENQRAKEKQIRNEPTTVTTIGDGISTVLNGLRDYYVVEQRVDDINYDRAFENFWKYGYWINKFEKPDIQSRKYFNYILTNGAIITGAINQTIRDVIASIFDAGVTIFHYDSGDTKTRKLEYTDKENIEVSLL